MWTVPNERVTRITLSGAGASAPSAASRSASAPPETDSVDARTSRSTVPPEADRAISRRFSGADAEAASARAAREARSGASTAASLQQLTPFWERWPQERRGGLSRPAPGPHGALRHGIRGLEGTGA